MLSGWGGGCPCHTQDCAFPFNQSASVLSSSPWKAAPRRTTRGVGLVVKRLYSRHSPTGQRTRRF